MRSSVGVLGGTTLHFPETVGWQDVEDPGAGHYPAPAPPLTSKLEMPLTCVPRERPPSLEDLTLGYSKGFALSVRENRSSGDAVFLIRE